MLTYYFIFCLATTITSLLVLYYPVVQILREESINNVLVRNIWVSYISMTLLFLVTAPALFLVLLSGKAVDIFKNSLLKSFLS